MPADFRRDDGRRVTNAISRRLATEATAGTVDPLRFPEVPTIPTVRKALTARDLAGAQDLSGAVLAMKQILDLREGRSGSVLDKALTMRDLMDEGLAAFKFGNQTITGSAPGSVTIPGGGYIDPRPVLLIPPALENFTATAAFRNVILDWDMLDYANHAFVEIWRSTTDALGTATLIGTTTANLFSDASGVVGTTYYYWARAIAVGGALGPFNAVGGTAATLGTITGTDLDDFIVTAEKLSQGTYAGLNLVPNPGAEDDTAAWAQHSGVAVTFEATTDDKTSGSKSFRITKALATDTSAYCCLAFPVLPGETYSVKLRTRSNTAGAAGMYIRMEYKASQPVGGYVTSALRDGFTTLLSNGAMTTAWATHEFIYTAPASAFWVSFAIYNWSTSSATQLYWDDVSVGRQITASNIAVGTIVAGNGIIANAAITNALIANLAVDSAKIADAAIVTAKIADLNVTGAKIADATITNAKIVNATITGAKIANATIDTANIANAAITNALINDLSADKINAGAIRAINVAAAAHTTKGSHLTASCSSGATTLNLHNTTDFPSSGTGIIYETGVNDYDSFTYSGKTSTTLTGVSGVLAHGANVVVIPAGSKSVVVDSSTNELRMWDDRGDGTYARVVQIGASNSDDAFAVFGHSSGTHHGVRAYTATKSAIRGESSGAGFGVEAISSGSGHAVAASASGGGNAVFGSSSHTSGAGVRGSNSSNGHGIHGSSTGSGTAVYGDASGGTGPGARLFGNATRAPVRLETAYTTAPTNADFGQFAMIRNPTSLIYHPCFADNVNWRIVGGFNGSATEALWNDSSGAF